MPSSQPPLTSARRCLRPASGLWLLLAALLVSATPIAAQGLKLGVFDKQQLVDESKLGLQAKDRFEKLAAAREQEVGEKQRTFEALQQSYAQRASVLSEDKKLDLQRELARARDEWQSAAGNADKDLQRAYQSALVEILTKIDPVVQDYGRSNGYDFIFDASQKQVEYWRDAHDITAALLVRLNALTGGE